MANIIKIKRSATTATPSALAEGELAYSESSGNLFIGISGDNVATVGGATDHTKLSNVANNANNYSHPTGEGNKHVPAAAAVDAGKVLSTTADGTLSWASKNDYSHPTEDGDKHVPTGGTSGQVLSTDGSGAYTWVTKNNYSHLTTDGNKHIPTSAATDAGKVLSADGDGTYSWVTKNDYSHPTGEGNKHVPAAGTGDNGKVLSTDTGGNLSWVTKTNYSHPTGDSYYHLPMVGTLGTEEGHVLKAGANAGEHSWEPEFTYTHPTTAGNKHVPTGGTTGQLLGYSASGTATWVDNPTVVDSWNSTDTDAPLSANMGREIYDRAEAMFQYGTSAKYHDHDTLVFYQAQALQDIADEIGAEIGNHAAIYPELNALINEVVGGIQNGDIDRDGSFGTSDLISILRFMQQLIVDDDHISDIGQYLINAMVADPATYANWHGTGYLKTSGGALSGDITVPDTSSMGFIGNTFASSDVTAWKAAATWHSTMTATDTDDIINTVNELVAAFEDHSETLNLITELDGKLTASSIIDGGTF